MSFKEEPQEFVTLKQIAERTHYSLGYLRNHWPRLLALKPMGFGRKLLFDWSKVVRRIQEKGN